MATFQRPRRVLFLDDDHSLMLADLGRLADLDVEIDLYKSAETALNAYRADPTAYDLVVVDLMLDEMWGDEFAAKVREMNPSQRLIIWTGELGPLSLGNRLAPSASVQSKPHEIYDFLKSSLEIAD